MPQSSKLLKMGKVTENSEIGVKKRGAKGVVVRLLREHLFGISILACAAIAFAFPSAFTEWGGVKLAALVVPAIQVIMVREIMLYYLANG